jgi:hypothetical protein
MFNSHPVHPSFNLWQQVDKAETARALQGSHNESEGHQLLSMRLKDGERLTRVHGYQSAT